MARGVNKVILVGNLGNAPDVKYTQGGTAITTLSVATTSQFKDREGNRQEKTEWHRVKLFGKLGEIAGEYLKKGRQVYIEGRLSQREYTDREGNKRTSLEVNGTDMQFIGSRGDEMAAGASGGNRGASQAPSRENPPPANDTIGDDDIPF